MRWLPGGRGRLEVGGGLTRGLGPIEPHVEGPLLLGVLLDVPGIILGAFEVDKGGGGPGSMYRVHLGLVVPPHLPVRFELELLVLVFEWPGVVCPGFDGEVSGGHESVASELVVVHVRLRGRVRRVVDVVYAFVDVVCTYVRRGGRV